MKVFAIRILFAVILFMGSSCITDKEPVHRSIIGVGDRLPDFIIEMNDGSIVATDNLAGQTAVIVFFNTGCSDCQRELPVVQELHNEYPELTIICIARDEKRSDIEKYWQQTGLTLSFSPQNGRAVYNLFAEEGIPRIYISDKNLIVTAVFDDSDMPSFNTLADSLK